MQAEHHRRKSIRGMAERLHATFPGIGPVKLPGNPIAGINAVWSQWIVVSEQHYWRYFAALGIALGLRGGIPAAKSL
jgi:hypothetical protein